MTDAVTTAAGLWQWQWIRGHLLRTTGVVLHLVLRTLFGIFWLAAGVNKIRKDWLTTDILNEIFLDRLTELPPDSFAVLYLQSFAIPLWKSRLPCRNSEDGIPEPVSKSPVPPAAFLTAAARAYTPPMQRYLTSRNSSMP